MQAPSERRARLTRHEHQLGEWERARRPPDGRPLPDAGELTTPSDFVARQIPEGGVVGDRAH
ncbi:MAG TPA: hypothetical protein VHX62_11585 [Solirubrobacteraceae bacterium]|nr:hypothetical protein [Solirubrobacteraceae bacterium]